MVLYLGGWLVVQSVGCSVGRLFVGRDSQNKNKNVSDQTRPYWTRPEHTIPDWTGLDPTRPNRIGPDWTGQDLTGPDRIRPDRTGLTGPDLT